jgi:hypothetical protein
VDLGDDLGGETIQVHNLLGPVEEDDETRIGIA